MFGSVWGCVCMFGSMLDACLGMCSYVWESVGLDACVGGCVRMFGFICVHAHCCIEPEGIPGESTTSADCSQPESLSEVSYRWKEQGEWRNECNMYHLMCVCVCIHTSMLVVFACIDNVHIHQPLIL